MKFIDATFGVDELLLTGEERMGIGRDADGDEAVLNAVDDFLFLGSLRGAGHEARSGGHVNEDNRIVFRMEILFHGIGKVPTRYQRGGPGRMVKTEELSSGHPTFQKFSQYCCKTCDFHGRPSIA